LIAWQWQLEGALKGNLLLHLIFALAASEMTWLLCGWGVRQRSFPERTSGIIFIPDTRLGKIDCRIPRLSSSRLFHLVT